MEPNGSEQDRGGIAAGKALAGILALLVEEREERVNGNKDATKIEVMLARAGLSNEDIAAVTGKKADTVRVAIHRAKAK
ncbi:MAG: sigma factor-like helix-turn-helix DNA-binding protein [Thermoleophilaceae bacterium]